MRETHPKNRGEVIPRLRTRWFVDRVSHCRGASGFPAYHPIILPLLRVKMFVGRECVLRDPWPPWKIFSRSGCVGGWLRPLNSASAICATGAAPIFLRRVGQQVFQRGSFRFCRLRQVIWLFSAIIVPAPVDTPVVHFVGKGLQRALGFGFFFQFFDRWWNPLF